MGKRVVISKFSDNTPKKLKPAFRAGVLGTLGMAGKKAGR